jgi:NosR/NirI family nitrous oxide reductase transcriptional regulator
MQLYFERLRNLRVNRPLRRNMRGADAVSGATISSILMYSAILMSGRKAGRIQGIEAAGGGDGLFLDIDRFEERDWDALLVEGSISHLSLTNGEIEAAFAQWQDPNAPRSPEFGDDDALFADIYAAITTPAGVGRNIMGNKWYNHHVAMLDIGDQLLLLASSERSPLLLAQANNARQIGQSRNSGGRFDRVWIRQGGRKIGLSRQDVLLRPGIRIDGAPHLDEKFLFKIPTASGFDPLWPFSLEFTVKKADAPGMEANGEADAEADAEGQRTFTLNHRLPIEFVSGDEDSMVAAGLAEPRYALFGLVRERDLNQWQQLWVNNAASIAILVGLLVVLTAILLLQDVLSKYRRTHLVIRFAFLAVVLVWLGWMKDAQLTVIILLTYVEAAFGAVDWRLFLIDPLIFILSVYVGLSLILWGRGVYCGWLCPFGALQEIANRIGRLFRIPQITLPEALQEKLWTVKYIAMVVIAGIAAWSMDAAGTAAEIEPFKTAIVVGFDRSWPYVTYAVILVVLGLTMERFFCRFLCPLGGGLAMLGRFRLLTWLKRRPQCGNPCAVCNASCPVGAIRNDGAIDMNECFQCLDCQIDYYDDKVCPPLVARRKRLERLTPAVALDAS